MVVIVEAVSWKNRRVKVAGRWHDVHPAVNLLQLRVGEENIVDTALGLDGQPVVMKVRTKENQ